MVPKEDCDLWLWHAQKIFILSEPRHEKTCLRVRDKVRLKPGSSAIETSQSLEISAITSRDITLSRQRKQRRWSVCADAQADLRLCFSHLAKPGVLMTWLIYSDLPHSAYKVFTCGFFILCIVHFCLLSKYLCWMHKEFQNVDAVAFWQLNVKHNHVKISNRYPCSWRP